MSGSLSGCENAVNAYRRELSGGSCDVLTGRDALTAVSYR